MFITAGYHSGHPPPYAAFFSRNLPGGFIVKEFMNRISKTPTDMTRNLIAQEIKMLSELIHEQQQIILSHTSHIPAIELDLLMQNIRNLYDRLLMLKKLNDEPMEPEPVPPPARQQRSYPQPRHPEELLASLEITPQADPEPAPEVRTNAEAHVQADELLTSVDTPVVSNERITEDEVLPLVKERAKEFSKPSARPSAATLFDDTPTVAEQFQPAPSLHDKLTASREDKSLAVKLSKNPVTDLKKSIGINEKFSFINELFDGDMNRYTEVIDKLNHCAGYGEASGMLESLAGAHGWNADGESFGKLKELVERRFA
jgi:hypothetical protein